MSRITDAISQIAEPVINEHGCTLWDVEFVKEAGTYFLRVYIDKEGGVGINDCEAISRALDPILDEKDLIEESYVFEVGSAGCERELKRPRDFEQFMGQSVEVKLYKAIQGRKSFVGELRNYNDGDVTISVGDIEYQFTKSDIAHVNLHAEF